MCEINVCLGGNQLVPGLRGLFHIDPVIVRQDDGRPLLTAERIGVMNQATVLVNTARAGLVDAGALLKALDSGRVACYATDVFETEPPQASPLLDHPKVVLTSHIGGFTDASVERDGSGRGQSPRRAGA